MPEGAESVIGRVLEPGEKIIWTGRPDVEALMDHNMGRRKRNRAFIFAVMAIAAVWMGQDLGYLNLSTLLAVEPKVFLAMSVPVVLIALAYRFGFDNRSRLTRHFRSLSYGMTDRRLLIVDGNSLESCTPEQMQRLRIRERAPGLADVIFGERSVQVDGEDRVRDPIRRERRYIGFKGLTDAAELQERIEGWLRNCQSEAARELADFVQAAPVGKLDALPPGVRRIENPGLGLTLDAPEEWAVQVRIEGPSQCKVEVEVFETAPTVTCDKLIRSKLADSLVGRVVASEVDCDINGVRGFSVTRRNDIQVDPATNTAGIAGVVAPERHMVLHDGRRQLYIVCAWPERA